MKGEFSVPKPRPVQVTSEGTSLRQVFVINVLQCVGGFATGYWADSTALVGSAVDNLADASVYAVSLYAISRGPSLRRVAARLSGWLLVLLAVAVLLDVTRRFFGGSSPIGGMMIGMALLNALVNVGCSRILARHRDGGMNIRASAIFTNNDTVVNLGIAISGALVWWTASPWPDLVVGAVVASIGLAGAKEIFALARGADVEDTSEHDNRITEAKVSVKEEVTHEATDER